MNSSRNPFNCLDDHAWLQVVTKLSILTEQLISLLTYTYKFANLRLAMLLSAVSSLTMLSYMANIVPTQYVPLCSYKFAM